MNDNYFNLSPDIQKALLQTAANQLNLSESVIEKDIWVCWVLKQIFSLPLIMAFKGGTSLSKAYKLIHRFSEDIDITIDYRNFKTIDFEKISRSQLKLISEALKVELALCIEEIILPHLKKQISQLLNKEKFSIEFDGKENLKFYYPSVVDNYFLTEDNQSLFTEDDDFIVSENHKTYLRDHVLIEFGVRNTTEPHEQHTIITFLSKIKFEKPLNLPEAQVDVLSAIRTFWEKATLIHVECHRKRLRENPERLSRHWYDLAMLINAEIAKTALSQINILENVIEHKKAFFNASYAYYDDCLNKKFRLLPDKEDEIHLERDYNSMTEAGMFSREPMEFQMILEALRKFEREINESL